MTRPGIEPRSPGPLVSTLTIMPMSGLNECKQMTDVELLLLHSKT